MEPTRATDELLQHSGWLRALARSLVADEQTADDLVQDTLTVALRRPPQREARPWLRRVLKNVLLQRLRGESRRVSRERLAARAEELPSSAELAARMELQKALVEHVLKLPEPYRSTVVLRYYEGLTAAEIARKRGLPGATVRSHLKRGLDELRRRLDEDHGGRREAWSALFLPWLDVKPIVAPAGPSALPQGVLTMSTGMKLLAGSAAIAVAIISFEWVRPNTPAPPEQALAGAPAATQLVAADEAVEVLEHDGAELEPQRAVATTPAAGEVLPAPTDESLLLTARIVDEHLTPLKAAVLTLSGYDLSGESDASGAVRLAFDPPGNGRYRLEVSCDGFATRFFLAEVKAHAPTALGDVVLQPGGTIAGRIVDAGGQPVADARVLAHESKAFRLSMDMLRRNGPDTWEGAVEVQSGAGGAFVLPGVMTGFVRVWARSEDSIWTISEPVEVRARERTEELELVLERAAPEDFVEGVVLTPGGVPVPDCFVRCEYKDGTNYIPRFETSDEAGRFRFLAIARAPHDLRTDDPDGRWAEAVLKAVEPGTRAVLQFVETRALRFELRAADGGAVPDGTIAAISKSPRSSNNIGTAERSEAAGAFELREPDELFHLQVRADGFVQQESGPYEPGELTNPVVLTLVRLASMNGRVLRDGRPVANVPVAVARRIVAVGDSFQVIHHGGFLTELDPYARADVKTDAEGRFQLSPQEAGDYAIRAEWDGYAPGELRVEHYDPLVGRDGLEITLSSGGSIEGEVLVLPGDDVAGTQVVISRGDAHHISTRVGADGIFRFERLIPGRWNVEAVEDELGALNTVHQVSKQEVELPWVCEVYEGETTYHDLDLSMRAACEVHGRLVVDGEAASNWTASLRTSAGYSGRQSENPQVVLDADGNFKLSVDKPRAYGLTLHAPQGSAPLEFQSALTLEPGTLTWQLDVQTGRAEFENLPPAAEYRDALWVKWQQAGASSSYRLEPDENGRCTLERFPVGDVRVVQYSVGPWKPDSGSDVAVGRIEAGQTARFVIP